MASVTAFTLNELLRLMPKNDPNAPINYKQQRATGTLMPDMKGGKGVSIKDLDLNGVHAELIEKVGNDKGTMFYIHGGAFSAGAAKERRIITLYIAKNWGYNVIAIDYRLAPENPFPACLDDIRTAYKAVLDMGYDASSMFFLGESAGAHLVLSLGLWAKDQGLALPKAIVSYSPCIELAEGTPSHFNHVKSDHMLGAICAGETFFKDIFGPLYTDMDYRKSPYVSPLYGNYTGMPPIFLDCSDQEIFYDDTTMLYQKLKENGNKVELNVAKGLMHSYQVLPVMKEALKTLNMTLGFVDAC